MLKSAEIEVVKMKERARKEVKEEMQKLAIQLAEKIINEKLDSKKGSALVDNFIDEMGRTIMADNKVGRRYAEAIFSVGESNNNLQEIYEALNSLMEMYLKDKEFKNLIDHPLISLEEKKSFLDKIFVDESQEVKNILFYLLDKRKSF